MILTNVTRINPGRNGYHISVQTKDGPDEIEVILVPFDDSLIILDDSTVLVESPSPGTEKQKENLHD